MVTNVPDPAQLLPCHFADVIQQKPLLCQQLGRARLVDRLGVLLQLSLDHLLVIKPGPGRSAL